MSLFFRLAIASFASALALASSAAPTPSSAEYANGIAAIVEDKVITVEDVRREMDPLIPQLRMQCKSEDEFNRQLAAMHNEIVQSMVDRYLLTKAFDKKEWKVPTSYVETRYEDTIREEFEGDRGRFLAYLRDRGITSVEYRREIVEQLKVDYMRSQMYKSGSFISPARIEAYYKANSKRFETEAAVKLRIIRVSPITNEGLEVLRQSAEKIIQEFRAGASFADLARRYSQDSRKKDGGDWGWVTRGQLQAKLSDTAFALEKGAISEPLVLGRDVFILFAEDQRQAGLRPLEDCRSEIEKSIASQMLQETQRRTIEQLRKEFFVRFY